jgi:isopentenyldiphosphate isomerase
MLIQRRALSKYHSGGLWANSCCSHPRYGERFETSVQNRLRWSWAFPRAAVCRRNCSLSCIIRSLTV